MPTTIRCASRLRPWTKRTCATSSPSRFGPLHLLQELGVDRMALFLQHIEREGDVGRRDLRAVEEARLGPQPEAIVELVGRNPHRLGEQAIDGIGLVAVGRHQRVESGRHAGRAVALPGVDVERVESVEVLVAARSGDLERQQAAGRRVRVDIGEMREVGRQSEVAERRKPVGFDRSRRRARRTGEKPAPPARRPRRPSAPPCGSSSWSSNRPPHGSFRAVYRACALFASERGENEAPAGAGLKAGLNFVHEARGRRLNPAPLPSAPATVLYMRAMEIRDSIANEAEAAPRTLRPLTTAHANEAAELIRTAFGAQNRRPTPPSSALLETGPSIAGKTAAGGGFGVFEGGALVGAALWSLNGDALHVARVSVAAGGARSRIRPLADRGLRNRGAAPQASGE